MTCRPEHWKTSCTAHLPQKRTLKRRNGVREKDATWAVEKIKEHSSVLPPERGSIDTNFTANDDPVRLSFKPRFFSTQSNATTSMERDDDDSVALQNPDDITLNPSTTEADGMMLHPMWRPTWFEDRKCATSPHAAKRSKGTSTEPGPLLKRMQSIRQSIQGDVVRLSSGQYPFSLRQVDRNDPRNRANTIMDVTILANPSAMGEQSLVTLPCFIHQWMKVTSDSDRTLKNVDHPKRHVSIMFTCDTMQEQGIVNGSQLRIYNAIYIPIRQPNATPTGIDPFDNSTVSAEDGVIVCTQLCEPYPKSILPPLVLPDMSAS
jgi:hypothetical protein